MKYIQTYVSFVYDNNTSINSFFELRLLIFNIVYLNSKDEFYRYNIIHCRPYKTQGWLALRYKYYKNAVSTPCLKQNLLFKIQAN